MYKQTFFSAVLSYVSDMTGVSSERITGKAHDTESTDARYIVASLLSDRGFYPAQIAEFLRRTPRSIRWLLSRKTSKMLLVYLKKARDYAAGHLPAAPAS